MESVAKEPGRGCELTPGAEGSTERFVMIQAALALQLLSFFIALSQEAPRRENSQTLSILRSISASIHERMIPLLHPTRRAIQGVPPHDNQEVPLLSISEPLHPFASNLTFTEDRVTVLLPAPSVFVNRLESIRAELLPAFEELFIRALRRTDKGPVYRFEFRYRTPYLANDSRLVFGRISSLQRFALDQELTPEQFTASVEEREGPFLPHLFITIRTETKSRPAEAGEYEEL